MLDAAYFDWIATAHDAALLQRDRALEHLVARSVELKAGVVAADPFDRAGAPSSTSDTPSATPWSTLPATRCRTASP
jgi:hypothetical protein